MTDVLRLHNIVYHTRTLGPGDRTAIWFQGCRRRCKGCMSESSRPMDGGWDVSIPKLCSAILQQTGIEGVTISGGEPFLQAEALYTLISGLRSKSNLGVIVYTGYTIEQLKERNDLYINRLLDGMIDLLIDGEYVDELNDENVTKVIGHDRGIRFLVTSYDSDGKTSFISGNEVKQKRGHYKLLRKQLQKRRTPSARRRLKSIGQRENRWMSDVNHRISKALTESNPRGTVHVLEDLKGIRSATERVRVRNRYVSVSWAYYDLEKKLTYKALERGQKVIKIDPRHTSQQCPVCGHTERGNRNKGKHVFCCRHCGYTSNDDRIGAMNIYRKGIEYLGSRIPV